MLLNDVLVQFDSCLFPLRCVFYVVLLFDLFNKRTSKFSDPALSAYVSNSESSTIDHQGVTDGITTILVAGSCFVK